MALTLICSVDMIATKVDNVYGVQLPTRVKSLLDTFAIGVSFGINGMSSVLECLGMPRYTHRLVICMVTPMTLVLLIFIIALTRMLCNRGLGISLTEMALPPILKLVFLAYPLVTNLAFGAFACYTFTESDWLKVDVAVQCGTDEHDEAIRLAWIAIILYPIGLLALNGGLLYAARKSILTNKHTALSRAIAFLYRDFEKQLFWWEGSVKSKPAHPCL